jgi:Na+/H+-dicarboxylate symporter
MNGCAAFILATGLFVAASNGFTFTLLQMLGWVFIATIAAIGNAGVPMGCYFLTTALLAAMNIPVEMMGIILPFYTFLDMVETSLNVWSDASVALIVDKETILT